MKTFRFFFESRDVEVEGDFVAVGSDSFRVSVVNEGLGRMIVAGFPFRNCLGYVEVEDRGS